MANECKFDAQNLEAAAKTAIGMEEEGYSLYTEAAGRSKNPLGRTTLLAIAEKELMHKREIQKFYNHLTGKEVKELPSGEKTKLSDCLKSEVLSGIKQELKAGAGLESDLLKTYELAMEMEKSGYAFYSDIAAKTDDPAAKKLFEFLAKEENSHYEMFQDTYLYLSNPSEWFKKEEKWLVEG